MKLIDLLFADDHQQTVDLQHDAIVLIAHFGLNIANHNFQAKRPVHC